MRTHHFDRHSLGSDWETPFSIDARTQISSWEAEDIVEVGLRGGGPVDDYGYHQDDAFAEWSTDSEQADGYVVKRDPYYVDIVIPAHALSQWGAGTLDVAVRWRNGERTAMLLRGRLPVW